MTLLRGCVLYLLLLAVGPAVAQERPVRIAGVASQERMAPLLQLLGAQLPRATLSYDWLSSAQIAAAARRSEDVPFDLALLASPDIAVSVANEGYAFEDEAAGAMAIAQWRNEVFGIWSDPAVMVLRRAAFPDRMPQTRIELVRALEQGGGRFDRRVGIINIGIDDVSYLLASQDSLRSTLYWRLMRAFGAAKARIYDTTDDILDALQAGDLDILYNVPLSALLVAGDPPEGMEIVVPQDYVLAVPWSVFVPKGAANPRGGRSLLHSLLAPQNKIAFSSVGFEVPDGLQGLESIQKIELGPELLVFRDMIKRSKFLDAWFQAVVD
jgi:iron(III) transport system substrate-binding protein